VGSSKVLAPIPASFINNNNFWSFNQGQGHSVLEHLVFLRKVTAQLKKQFGSQNVKQRLLGPIFSSYNLEIGVFGPFTWQRACGNCLHILAFLSNTIAFIAKPGVNLNSA